MRSSWTAQRPTHRHRHRPRARLSRRRAAGCPRCTACRTRRRRSSRRAARLGRWAPGPLALGSADVSVRSICTIVWVLTCVTAACLLSTCVWERHQRRGRQGTPARRAEPSRPLLRPRVLRACGEMRRDAPLGRQHTPQFSGPRDALQHAPATSACACLRCAACPACGSDRGESQRHTLQERA